jgi:membrane protein implicated in regulation of membrane protease activity
LLLLIALGLPPTILGIVNPGERVLYPALIAFAIAVCAEPKLPLAPKVTLTAAFIGGYGLLAIALIPASR